MEDEISRLFSEFDRGKVSRRQLLQTLGFAAAAAAVPMNLFAQGRCGGANAGTANCDTTPAKAPFAPTGWKTVYMDHFSLKCADYKKEAAYYAALMNWKVRSDDGTKAYLDIGDDVGGVILRGGYVAPPPPPPRVLTPAESAAAAGRGGGRGGGGRGQRAPLTAVWDSYCWGIEPWDTKKVETGTHEARTQSRCRSRRQGFPEFPRERSRRLRRADQQRQQEKSPPRRREGESRRGRAL